METNLNTVASLIVPLSVSFQHDSRTPAAMKSLLLILPCFHFVLIVVEKGFRVSPEALVVRV